MMKRVNSQRILLSALLLGGLSWGNAAHASSCSELADEAEAQLATAQIREDYENVQMLAKKALSAGSRTACGAQANSILKEVQKALRKLDEDEKRAENEKAAKEQAKKDAERERAKSDKSKASKKGSPDARLLDYRLSFSGEKRPKEDVIAMVDGRVVPLGYSELASTGAHELVLSPPRGDKKQTYDFEVLVDRKKLEPISTSENEQVYTFDSKKGASLTLQITVVPVELDSGPRAAKKPFPWGTVVTISGAVLFVGGGSLAVWKYLEGAPKDDRITDLETRHCDYDRGQLTCNGGQADYDLLARWYTQRNDAWGTATVGAVIGGVGVGLMALGIFVLNEPSEGDNKAAKGVGGGVKRKAPSPSLSYDATPSWDVVPVFSPEGYGLSVQGSF